MPSASVIFLRPAIDAKWRKWADGERFNRLPSLGLQYLAAALRQAGRSCAIHDQTIHPLSPADFAAEVRAGGFAIVGVHANVLAKENAINAIRAVRAATTAKIMVGGPGSMEAEDYLDAGADAVCRGEGETRLLPLCDALLGGEPVSHIPGLRRRDDHGGPVAAPPAPMIDDLDSLPFPDRSRQVARFYSEPGNPAQRGRFCVTLAASRGCPHQCSFCTSHEIWNKTYRVRSAANVIEEIAVIQAQYPRAPLVFVDDAFYSRPAWVEEFCGKMADRRPPVRWRCDLHPLSFAGRRDRFIPLMARAGCTAISFGVQSGSPQILQNVRRDPRELVELAEMLRLCHKRNILTFITFIFGLPGETTATIDETIRRSLRLPAHLADYHPLVVLPGSAIDREFGNRPVCEATKFEIEHAVARAFRRFYVRPRQIARVLWLVARRNPGYFFRAFRPAIAGFRKFAHGKNTHGTA